MAGLSRTVAFWSIFSLIVLAVVMYSVGKGDLVEMVRSYIRSDLLTANATLKTENEKHTEEIERLDKT